jgi:hypothetical protein
MSDIDRRTFLAALAALPAVAAWPAHAAGVRAASLHSLADAILPTELGSEGINSAVDGFRGWLDRYQPGAELDHGYGSGTLRYAAADPRPQWTSQLEELDADARGQHSRAFDTLDRAARRHLVASRLDTTNADRLPAPLAARHIALAFLAWFYTTPTAHDLGYRARIVPLTCRPLHDVTGKPRAL